MTAAGHGDAFGHLAPPQHAVSLPRLLFGLFGAPAAWAVQLISNYALLAHFCYPQGAPLAAPTFGGVQVVAIVTSGTLLVVALVALLVANRACRRTRVEPPERLPGGDHEPEASEIDTGRMRFMAMAGLIVSGIFIYGIIMAGVPLLTMSTCTL